VRKVIRTLSALVLTGLIVSGCVTATPYQPLNPGQKAMGGYVEQQLEANRYRLSFAGNSVTKRETVETYLLYRAAELTLAQGYESFSVVQRATDRKARTLDLVLSRPISVPAYLLGKLVGIGAWLAMILAAVAVISWVSISLITTGPLPAGDSLRLAGFYAVAWVLLLAFVEVTLS
jgi:hypothetical protein